MKYSIVKNQVHVTTWQMTLYTDLHLASLQSVDVYVGQHRLAQYFMAPAAVQWIWLLHCLRCRQSASNI